MGHRSQNRVYRRPGSCESSLATVACSGERKMSNAAQAAFDETVDLASSELSFQRVQLLTALTTQASRNVELCALIKGFADSIGCAVHSDCTFIALVDSEDSH